MRYDFCVREASEKDWENLMKLYMQLHDNPMPEKSERQDQLWKQILLDPNHHIIVAEQDGKIISSCVCVIIPNLTHEQRPYAFVENVITDQDYRKKGYATQCLNYAKTIAQKENCYKMMLLTGSKQESTLKFYEQAGYNRKDKTAFIQWL
nr:GNAT family N-acetyltransferase [Anaerosporobacter faecicola]